MTCIVTQPQLIATYYLPYITMNILHSLAQAVPQQTEIKLQSEYATDLIEEYKFMKKPKSGLSSGSTKR